jgi:Sel1 repeat
MHPPVRNIAVWILSLILAAGCTQPSQDASGTAPEGRAGYYPDSPLAGSGAGAQTPTSADDYQAAHRAMSARDYAEAMRFYQRIAEGKDTPSDLIIPRSTVGKVSYQDMREEAQEEIGMMYFHGWGVPQDYAAARYWLQKAVDTGGVNTNGPTGILADMYRLGLGGPPDYQKYRALSPIEEAKRESDQRKAAAAAVVQRLQTMAASGSSTGNECRNRCWEEAKRCNFSLFVGGQAFPTPSNLSFTCSLPYSLCTAGCR